MKPRNLRHHLEKAAKLLVLVQKHAADINCSMIVEKGEYGYIIAQFEGDGSSRTLMNKLGRDLESKGYSFVEKKSPWLGEITYEGKAPDKTSIVLQAPIVKDRLGINEGSTDRSYSFASM